MNESTKQPIKMTPGDDTHLTMLMAPCNLNFFVGKDREDLLAYGRAAFEAGKAGQCLHQIQEPSAAEQAAWHAGLDEGRAQAAPAAVAVPGAAIAGALFDFCGYLTTLPLQQAITASEAHEASPMVEALEQWAAKRNLQLDDADVQGWRAALAATLAAAACEAEDVEQTLNGGGQLEHRVYRLSRPVNIHPNPPTTGLPSYAYCAAPAVAPLALSGLDAAASEVMVLVLEYGKRMEFKGHERMRHCTLAQSYYMEIQSKLRALLATATGLPAHSVEPVANFGLSAESIEKLRTSGLKPEEIAGDDPAAQLERVRELVWWFARLSEGHANPKWLTGHAFELAYYIACMDVKNSIDLEPIKRASYKEGAMVSPSERAMLERIGFLKPLPQAQADARDAGRWRAATRNMEINDVAVVIYDSHGNERTITGDEADAAIDAAIAAQAAAKEGAQE